MTDDNVEATDGASTAGTELSGALWHDNTKPDADRVRALLSQMTLEEKVAQLFAVWSAITSDGADGGDSVAPLQHDFSGKELDFVGLLATGIGQLTRPFGTAPVDPTAGAKSLDRLQADIVAGNRFGIPALVHEECLTGFMTLGATVYPTPLAWGATFDAELVDQMAAQIGRSMRAVGVHQGLAPVLDVTRDARWGRTEETIGEDPYLVGTLGTAYVRGLQSAGVIATLKHFAGYSASDGARNFGPVAIGTRELADVLLPPFELAVTEGEAGSVMAAYTAIDGAPTHGDPELLTETLRRRWGFTGTVVSDYFGVAFLESQHHVVASDGDAANRALSAGLDVELPSVNCFGEPLLAAVRDGEVPESLIDRAVYRVLLQKCELGLLDPDWQAVPSIAGESVDEEVAVDLDPPEGRRLARRIAEESVVLVTNDGTLPMRADARIAVVGPVAEDASAMMGCYSFPNHIGRNGSDDGESDAESSTQSPLGVDIPTVLTALRAELPDAQITSTAGCGVTGEDTSGFARAAELAAAADVCVAVVGDRSGLFGRGTSGEGCDAVDLKLPGVQEELLRELVATGTPVVVLLLSGRPYALDRVIDGVGAVVQGFFPGEEGGPALAGVLSGRVCPSGRLPVSMPRRATGTPATYLTPTLGRFSETSSVDPTPLFAFGHGLSYTSFEWDGLRVSADGWAGGEADYVETGTDGSVRVSIRVRNTGARAGTDVVQLYLHDPVSQVARPVVQLVGYQRVRLEPGAAARVSFDVHADLGSYTGADGRRIVEPGDLELRFGKSSTDIVAVARVKLVGRSRRVDHLRHLTSVPSVTQDDSASAFTIEVGTS